MEGAPEAARVALLATHGEAEVENEAGHDISLALLTRLLSDSSFTSPLIAVLALALAGAVMGNDMTGCLLVSLKV